MAPSSDLSSDGGWGDARTAVKPISFTLKTINCIALNIRYVEKEGEKSSRVELAIRLSRML